MLSDLFSIRVPLNRKKKTHEPFNKMILKGGFMALSSTTLHLWRTTSYSLKVTYYFPNTYQSFYTKNQNIWCGSSKVTTFTQRVSVIFEGGGLGPCNELSLLFIRENYLDFCFPRPNILIFLWENLNRYVEKNPKFQRIRF